MGAAKPKSAAPQSSAPAKRGLFGSLQSRAANPQAVRKTAIQKEVSDHINSTLEQQFDNAMATRFGGQAPKRAGLGF